MIGLISGWTENCSDGLITLSALNQHGYGIGYEIHVGNVNEIVGAKVALWVHEHAPQDAPHELYGFREREDRDLFRRLLNVQGVGPKVAMRIVANAGVTRDGIVVPATLRAIRGVGPKIIQNICEAFS